MSIRLEIVLVKLQPISNKQLNPPGRLFEKWRTPLRENVAIWQYPTGMG